MVVDMVGPVVASSGVWLVALPVVFILLATAAALWIPATMARQRRRGQELLNEDAERGDLAAEVEQMRRSSAAEPGNEAKR